MSFFDELKRRNVFRVGIAYAVVAWVLLQAIDFALDIISAPNWVMQVFFIAGAAGLPLVLIFSWIFEMTPEGIKRESEIDRSDSITHGTGRKLDRTIIIFLSLAVVLLLTDKFILNEDKPSSPVNNAELAKTVDTPPGSDVQSIAVLPFVNMSSDPEQEYFSDGLAEELLNRLAQNPRLQVAARTSAFQFKGKNLDIGNIGQQLKVANVLEGSVRKSGNRLRITAQLVRVDNGFHLWSQTYDREIDDVFAIQDDISTAITQALEVELGVQAKPASEQPTESVEAYQLYLKARHLLAKRGGDNLIEATRLFKQAIELDQQFAQAWSGLAFTYALLPAYSLKVTAREASQSALEAAQTAIRIDPDNAEAYTMMARVQGTFGRDISTARENFEKSYQLAPNNADIVNLYGDFLTRIGDFKSAELMEQRATEMDPLAAVHYSDLAFLYIIQNRYEEALVPARNAARLAPDSYDRQDALITAQIMTGDYAAARQLINFVASELAADVGYVNSWWCMYYYQQGDRDNLRLKLDERNRLSESSNGYFPNVHTAFYTLALDGVDAALPLLEKSYQKKESMLGWPEFFYLPEQISDNPDWRAFWQKPGLSELMETRRQFGPYEHIGYWKGELGS
ncbi:MAG: hypothetical protein BMS9Abin30_0363 [Gammaproteobacteria bacterium]|nr:MAG: hypothetical protein BMS9Abin30_0363 [Gammaproteobacteria bacterium]